MPNKLGDSQWKSLSFSEWVSLWVIELLTQVKTRDATRVRKEAITPTRRWKSPHVPHSFLLHQTSSLFYSQLRRWEKYPALVSSVTVWEQVRERERETGGRRWRRVPHLLGSDPGDTTDVWTSCSHITSQVSNVTTLSPINRSQCPEGILYIPGRWE